MLEHFKGDETFVSKVLDYINQAEDRQMMVLTKFLDPHQVYIVETVIGHSLSIYQEGGFDGCENKRVIICPDYYEIEPEDFGVVVFLVKYNDQFGKLQHKDLLGALMHLGIQRDCIGDISKEPFAFACAKENADYIEMNLTKIKHMTVHLERTSERIEIKQDYKVREVVVGSLRLDKMISGLFSLSRSESSKAIKAGLVKVNYKIVEEVHYLCHNNDVISFRRHGRVKIRLTDRMTRANNLVVEGLYYK